jgi:lysozyme
MWTGWYLLVLLIIAGCSDVAGSVQTTGEESSSDEDVTACNPAATVEGVDVSDFQGAINWASARGAGIRFAFVKATQGTYNTQSRFAANWSGMKNAGVIRGAYHFFDPTQDGVAQANHFSSIVGTLEAGDLPPMLDLECPDGDARCLGFSGGSGSAPAATIRQRVNDWLNTVQSRTGKKPIIYTFGSYFSSNGISTSGLSTYPLYIAYPTTGNCYNFPAPWAVANFWQYSWTGSVAGISGQVDRDRFIGTLADLQAFAGGSGSGGGGAQGCNSATLAKVVPDGTCVQAASDAQWYHCSNGSWLAGETGCTQSFAYCHSSTLGRDVPARTCVQSRSNSVWYQCDMGWQTPVSNGAGPLGACSAMYPL